MTSVYRVSLATISSLILIVTGMFFITNVAAGSSPASFDSGTVSCTTSSLGYCDGPALPFAPNAVTLTVQSPISGPAIPSTAMAQLTSRSFRARFILTSGGAAANLTLTYSYVATSGTTPRPTATTTTTTRPPTTTTTTRPPTTTTTSTGSTGTAISAYITAYGWPDNDPPGTAIANPVIHNGAGGVGTFADPITLAVTSRVYAAGTKFYIPNVRRYFIVEDTCASCGNVPSGASVWVDMWAGGNGRDDSGVLACENAVTGNFTIIRDPDANRPVVAGSLYNSANNTCTAQFGG